VQLCAHSGQPQLRFLGVLQPCLVGESRGWGWGWGLSFTARFVLTQAPHQCFVKANNLASALKCNNGRAFPRAALAGHHQLYDVMSPRFGWINQPT
jgi:hypothetical protein